MRLPGDGNAQSLSARDGVPGLAQVHRKIVLRLDCRLKRHWIQLRIQLEHEPQAIPLF